MSLSLVVGCSTPHPAKTPELAAEQKAVAFLKREVPAWHRDNGCFSCHNNGDAARALYAAGVKGHRIPKAALSETTRWVTKPAGWDHNQGDPGFSDAVLADVQFASSLRAALLAGRAAKAEALDEALKRLIDDQDGTGAWPIEPKTAIASPATYGTPLATAMALRVLRTSDTPAAKAAAQKGETWLLDCKADNLPAAAATVLAFSNDSSNHAQSKRSAALNLIRRGQSSEGGWGPYADSPAEAFDTAIVLLALQSLPDRQAHSKMIRRGRDYLMRTQLDDGSWPPTTRPSGGDSYAQRLSTTGWATLALLDSAW